MSARRSTYLGLFLLAALSWTTRLEAGESYYVLVFASQSHPKLASRAHTWATFVRSDGANPPNLTVHTISWLPRTLSVRTFAPCPEPGVNLDLYRSIDVARADRQDVAMWGPYPISGDVYARSLRVWSTIEGGATEYRAISPANDTRITNCSQAVLAVGPELGGKSHPTPRTGFAAGQFIAREVACHSPVAPADHSWIVPRLGLDRYPIHFAPARVEASPSTWQAD